MRWLRHPAPEGLERAGAVNIEPPTYRVSKHCSETELDVICRPRANAMRRGDFRWDRRLRAWIDRMRPVRAMSNRTRYFLYSERRDLNHPDHSGEPIQIWDCPWCGVALPSLHSVAARPSLTQSDGAE
ncbi:MAG: hypothetical protein ACSLFE_08210 [Gemmatimonadaceae bacterium]